MLTSIFEWIWWGFSCGFSYGYLSFIYSLYIWGTVVCVSGVVGGVYGIRSLKGEPEGQPQTTQGTVLRVLAYARDFACIALIVPVAGLKICHEVWQKKWQRKRIKKKPF